MNLFIEFIMWNSDNFPHFFFCRNAQKTFFREIANKSNQVLKRKKWISHSFLISQELWINSPSFSPSISISHVLPSPPLHSISHVLPPPPLHSISHVFPSPHLHSIYHVLPSPPQHSQSHVLPSPPLHSISHVLTITLPLMFLI